MKKLVLLLISCLMLVGCGLKEPIKINENAKTNKLMIESEEKIVKEVSDDAFTLNLTSAKSVYKEGEQLEIYAQLISLLNENIEIGHGGSWVFLETTNITEGYEFGAVMIEPYIITPIASKQSIIQNYHFTGGSYSEGQLGNKYPEEELKKMATMKFPIGTYKIKAITDFIVEGETKNHKLETELIFEVVK